MSEFLELEPGERVLALASGANDGPGIALGTAQGVVKRVTTDYPGRDGFELVGLKDADEVVGAVELVSGDEDLVFVTDDAQLLRFGAASVRPQGRSAGGMTGIRLAPRARVVHFTAVPVGSAAPAGEHASAAVVVTVAGSSAALPGTENGTAKATPYAEYPAKGRATGGVRCHRFLKGEDVLRLAWVGVGPARGSAGSGSTVDLPAPDGRRDGSGTPLAQPVAAVGGRPLGA